MEPTTAVICTRNRTESLADALRSVLAEAAGARRLARRHGWPAVIRGLWLKRAFRGRYVLAMGGSPLPKVLDRGGTLRSGGCALWNGTRLEVGRGAELSIGRGTYLNRNTLVVCHERVTIGRNCRISWDVVIMDSDEHVHPGIARLSSPVTIEDGAWIGCRAIILKGVTVGEGAIVGAGSIVTHDVPPHTVAVGQPARVIRHLHPASAAVALNHLVTGA